VPIPRSRGPGIQRFNTLTGPSYLMVAELGDAIAITVRHSNESRAGYALKVLQKEEGA
jgi:acetamidase/formamidase